MPANGGSASTRPEWTEGAASGQAITNASPVVFDITGSGTVKGLFLVGGIANAQNKGNHEAGGVLWATALFGTGDVAVNADDQLKVTYTVSANERDSLAKGRAGARVSVRSSLLGFQENCKMATNKIYYTPGTIVTFRGAGGGDILWTMQNEGTGKGRISNVWDRGEGSLPARYLWRCTTVGLPPDSGRLPAAYLVTAPPRQTPR